MPTITKPMTIERAFESAKRFAEEAAKPHQIYMIALDGVPAFTSGYVIPITGDPTQEAFDKIKAVRMVVPTGVASRLNLPPDTPTMEPETPEEIVEAINGGMSELAPPRRRRMRSKLAAEAEPVYYHNPYKEEPLSTDMCARHLGISRTRFYAILRVDESLQKRAAKGHWQGARFTRYALDRWRKTSPTAHLPGRLSPPRGARAKPLLDRNISQPRCTGVNQNGEQCKGLAMKGYDICSVHAMRVTGKAKPNSHDTEGEGVAA